MGQKPGPKPMLGVEGWRRGVSFPHALLCDLGRALGTQSFAWTFHCHFSLESILLGGRLGSWRNTPCKAALRWAPSGPRPEAEGTEGSAQTQASLIRDRKGLRVRGLLSQKSWT